LYVPARLHISACAPCALKTTASTTNIDLGILAP